MTRIPSRVPGSVVVSGHEREVSVTHALSWEVGAERVVDAGVDYGSVRVEAERVGFGLRCVHPETSDLCAALEDHDGV